MMLDVPKRANDAMHLAMLQGISVVPLRPSINIFLFVEFQPFLSVISEYFCGACIFQNIVLGADYVPLIYSSKICILVISSVGIFVYTWH